jgi:hypothetical protein
MIGGSRNSSVSIATGLRVGRPRNLGSIPGRGKDVSLLNNAQTCSGTHVASYAIGTRGCFARGKAAGARSWLVTSA